MIKNEGIKRTAERFEDTFSEGSYYNLQTQDDSHLALILKNLKLFPGKRILDLGTGSGYLAFPIAEQNNECYVIGLDIVERTISKNNSQARKKGMKNLKFISYDGISFPFENHYFDIILSRYALHHFPDIDKCFQELSRVIKPHGQLFISDPTPNELDEDRFVDKYMKMKDDGHIKFYSIGEYIELGKKYKFTKEFHNMSKIRFPRKSPDRYADLLRLTDSDILDAYEIKITDREIFITEDVINISFIKN